MKKGLSRNKAHAYLRRNSGSNQFGRGCMFFILCHRLYFFLVEREKQHRIMENYNSTAAEGRDKGSSTNPFYHWGALDALIPRIEAGILGEVRNDERTSKM